MVLRLIVPEPGGVKEGGELASDQAMPAQLLSDRLAPKVLALVAEGRSYRLVGREVGLSKNTVAGIVKRSRTG